MASVEELVDEFQSIPASERLNLLLEYSDALPELPARYEDHPDLMERVEECQAPVFLFVELEQPTGTEPPLVRLFFSAPPTAPTTRGFASLLHSLLDGLVAGEAQNFDDAFIDKLGITELISPLRMRGMRAMLWRIKRQVSEKLESAAR